MRTSKEGNTVYLDVGIWYDDKQDAIHLVVKDPDKTDLHTTINRDPQSKRGHPNLFEKLTDCLNRAGAPAPTLADNNA